MGATLLAVALPVAGAAEPSGRELVEHVERLLWGRTNQGLSEMTVITPSWQRTMQLRFWMDRPERTLIRILAPPKDAGIGSLRIGDGPRLRSSGARSSMSSAGLTASRSSSASTTSAASSSRCCASATCACSVGA
jgi:hypothetical protein